MEREKNSTFENRIWGEAGNNKLYSTDAISNEQLKNFANAINANGSIYFKKNKTKAKIKFLMKTVIFITMASFSGAITASIIVRNELGSMKPRVNSEYNNYVVGDDSLTSAVGEKTDVTRVAEMVGPAVVGISNSAETFLGQQENKFSGSGIIFDSNGYIVTNYHVIEGSNKIMVKLASDNTKPVEAKLIKFDKSTDLAVIRINKKRLIAAKFGDSSKVRVGDDAIAIGNPLGEAFAGSVTAGIISATNRKIDVTDSSTNEKRTYKMLQTDAAINSGSSGGPLCNSAGEVIGINSLNLKDYAEGMGFAICSNDVKKLISSIGNNTKNFKVDFGTTGGPTNDPNKGIYVLSVSQDSIADKLGIKPTDIIKEVNGKLVTTYEEINSIINKVSCGGTIKCKVWRSGKIVTKSIILKN
ncbi:S1C family serine protease [Clostridium oryzae]|uniref:Serine protease Do-like HtrB n=1 Tax=Clostridium oryzae TaxID=1450648 RepID=A0A1V4IM31_9CLOT|nr:trypsin-like peptidase domain-containing protein [Clostridium oryzae]OPJ61082.1 serine protease Do-like HtrB [Clostridium oryzae]